MPTYLMVRLAVPPDDEAGPSAYSRLMATSLRSFLRFLLLRQETSLNLLIAIPTVRRWSRAPTHAFLEPEVVERILAVPDRSTASRRRDCRSPHPLDAA